jgi:AraC-like DNA-binding protein
VSLDTLSEVLRAVRLTGAVFFKVDASAPWVAEAPIARDIGPQLLPGAEHVLEYHVITRGSCFAGLVGETPVELGPGDAILFPQGDSHVLSSAPGMSAEEPDDVPATVRGRRLPVSIQRHGGGAPAEFVCGFLGLDARPYNPLLGALPRMIHLPRQGDDDVIAHFVKLALAESTAMRPGSDVMLARLSELLFVEVVRRYLATLPPEQGGWLGGLRDAGVGKALAKLHDRPSHSWTLEELGREAGLSRSVLAERFAHFVGVPPMQYLAQWRMQLASRLLSSTSLALAEIAEKVGYGSETALSHAFKRWVGVAPADYRRGKRPSSEP